MTAPVPYRTIAERTLGQAAAKLNEVPSGRVRADEIAARSAHAQAIATVAVAQALLEIGDVLRAALPAEPESPANEQHP
ncbi:hypothetical protein [Streptomyces sp. B15]|uniref:hypothetical protein n=1 Tax=Streptomyces sp. B15 TaxID=1537797 RepID=UPI001B35C831|nr:hypothetical protein [Streptomyces sp. B15]MBQ1122614.1 hypothetical protein [Streptomyces sp. B15]